MTGPVTAHPFTALSVALCALIETGRIDRFSFRGSLTEGHSLPVVILQLRGLGWRIQRVGGEFRLDERYVSAVLRWRAAEGIAA
jgi:hypothetical protein